jgi:hypothetical protein
MRFRRRYFAAMSPNGRKVHLANTRGYPVCGALVDARHRVHARITCPRCILRCPDRARRLARRPHVVGLNWEPLYRALGRALDAGATSEPKTQISYWPVLA